MEDAGLRVPWSTIVTSVAEVEAGVADGSIELPAIVRPAFTLGGQGGGVGSTPTELLQVVSEGLAASPINQVLVEESVIGWGEFELELMRDRNDNVVVICSIENVDPMGVHTGDSVTIAPAQTLTDALYQELRNQAIKVIRAVGVETGGSNIQFAVNPKTGEIVVIEMNPRVSRSSALASKATGFPIAKIAAKLAVGYALEEIPNDITQGDAGLVRAHDRLRGHQDAALRLREVPGARGRADHPHEVGGRGDGDRPHLPRVLRQGDALARAGLPGGDPGGHRGAPRRGSRRPPRTASTWCSRRSAATTRSRSSTARTAIDPWFLRELRALAREGDGTEGLVRGYKVGRHLRRRVRGRDALLLLGPRALGVLRGPPGRPRLRGDPRLRARTGSARASSSTTAACTPR